MMRHPFLRLTLMALVATSLHAPRVAGAWEHNIAVWPAEQFPLPIALRPEPARDLSNERLAEIIVEVFATWNAVACSFAELAYDGVQDLPIVVDDDQVLGWVADPETWVYGSASAGATIIDVMGPDGPRIDIAFNDVTFDWVEGANTLVLPGYEFGVDPNLEIDPASVIAHEVGHLLGLAHPRPQDPASQPDNLATMVFSLLPNAQQSSLAGDDKLGLCEKYPVPGGDECIEDEECAGDRFCATYEAGFGPVAVCEEPRGTWGDFCSDTQFICAGFCLFLAADLSAGECTTQCETDADCPEVDGEPWGCEGLPSADGSTLFACRPDSGTPGADVGVVDGGGGLTPVDAGDRPDTGGDDATGDAPSTPDAAASDPGAEPEPSEASDSGSAGGCASAPRGTGSSLTGLLLLLAWMGRRRRRG
jgi:uncharacterized protein (TIGR03382 family)